MPSQHDIRDEQGVGCGWIQDRYDGKQYDVYDEKGTNRGWVERRDDGITASGGGGDALVVGILVILLAPAFFIAGTFGDTAGWATIGFTAGTIIGFISSLFSRKPLSGRAYVVNILLSGIMFAGIFVYIWR